MWGGTRKTAKQIIAFQLKLLCRLQETQMSHKDCLLATGHEITLLITGKLT